MSRAQRKLANRARTAPILPRSVGASTAAMAERECPHVRATGRGRAGRASRAQLRFDPAGSQYAFSVGGSGSPPLSTRASLLALAYAHLRVITRSSGLTPARWASSRSIARSTYPGLDGHTPHPIEPCLSARESLLGDPREQRSSHASTVGRVSCPILVKRTSPSTTSPDTRMYSSGGSRPRRRRRLSIAETTALARSETHLPPCVSYDGAGGISARSKNSSRTGTGVLIMSNRAARRFRTTRYDGRGLCLCGHGALFDRVRNTSIAKRARGGSLRRRSFNSVVGEPDMWWNILPDPGAELRVLARLLRCELALGGLRGPASIEAAAGKPEMRCNVRLDPHAELRELACLRCRKRSRSRTAPMRVRRIRG